MYSTEYQHNLKPQRGDRCHNAQTFLTKLTLMGWETQPIRDTFPILIVKFHQGKRGFMQLKILKLTRMGFVPLPAKCQKAFVALIWTYELMLDYHIEMVLPFLKVIMLSQWWRCGCFGGRTLVQPPCKQNDQTRKNNRTECQRYAYRFLSICKTPCLHANSE